MIIFDMDGTLWDTSYSTLEAANKIADKYEIVRKFEMKTITDGMGLSFDENVKNYFPYLEYKDGSKFLDELINTNISMLSTKGGKLYDDVEATIEKLSKKYKLGIITNNNDDYVKIFFKTSGLEKYFSDYIGAATYGITKSDAIKKMVEKYGETTNYYIGDIRKDMEATLKAGIEFIHAKYGFEPTLEYKYSIDSIKKLPDYLEQIK